MADASLTSDALLARRERAWLLLILLGIALFYGVVAVRLNRLHSFWSPDSGPRLAMIRNWEAYGELVFLRYENADVDPEARFHPLGLLNKKHLLDGSVVRLPRGVCTHYPPLFPLLSSYFYARFGFDGLVILPLLGGLGALFVTYALARRLGLPLPLRLLMLATMGVATPLLIYSVVFWDHSIQMFLAALAGYLLLRAVQTERMRFAVGAGATLGAGLFFHELLGVLFVSLLVGSALVLREKSARRAVGGLALGFAPLLALWLFVNWRIYGLARGPHATVEGALAQSPEFHTLMSPLEILSRLLLQLLGYEVGIGWRVVALAGILALVYVASMALGGTARRAAPICCLLFAPVALGLVSHAVWAQGLFQATPLFLPALAFPRGNENEMMRANETDAVRLFYRWIWAACLVFTVAVIVNPQIPSLWGNRYLLNCVAFLAVLTARAFQVNYTSLDVETLKDLQIDLKDFQVNYTILDGLWRGLVVASFLALAGVSAVSEYLGMTAVRERETTFRDIARHIEPIKTQALVMDQWYLSSHLVETPKPRQFLVRDPDTEGEAFFHALEKLGIREFVYVGTPAGARPLAKAAAQHNPPFVPVEVDPKTGYARFVQNLTPRPPSLLHSLRSQGRGSPVRSAPPSLARNERPGKGAGGLG